MHDKSTDFSGPRPRVHSFILNRTASALIEATSPKGHVLQRSRPLRAARRGSSTSSTALHEEVSALMVLRKATTPALKGQEGDYSCPEKAPGAAVGPRQTRPRRRTVSSRLEARGRRVPCVRLEPPRTGWWSLEEAL